MKLGEIQNLVYKRKVEFGIYLTERESDLKEGEQRSEVLLPKSQVPGDAHEEDEISVFIYKDSSDRLIATVKRPLITLGQVTRLKVLETGKIGAFLDWGLEKDLLLPFREQTFSVKAGDEVLVALYIDKSSRLCATMKIYPYLEKGCPCTRDDQVEGTIYEISKQFGAFVAIFDRYSALIPAKECVGSLQPGQKVTARVTQVREDGKVNLAVRAKAYEMLDVDGQRIIELMEGMDGELPFNDKADPELIRSLTGMSKNEFKRAVGHLLKEGRVEITANSIKMRR